MTPTKTHLIETAYPDFGAATAPPNWRVPLPTYCHRLDQTRARMDRDGLTHLAVYADREHFANLAWLTGFDLRFEEALLILGPSTKPLLLAGNECMGYLTASPLVQSNAIEVRRYQPFSLPDQPRGDSSLLEDTAIDAHSKVGVAGWKSYAQPYQIDAPSYLVDALRFAAGWENVTNAAHLFFNPSDGLRTTATPEEIAFFEWTNTLASEGMKRVLAAIQPGARDYDLLEQARYNGVPLSAHMTLKCGANNVSLASARGERVTMGGRFSCGIAYWGANCCRCGWVAEGPGDLPPEAKGYVEHFAGPYFAAMAAWFQTLYIGAPGAALHDAIHSRLPADPFHVFLNAGHLIHLDEWVSSPVYPGSNVLLRSGMVMQSDVIPSHPSFYSSRMEDGYVLADATLQSQLSPALLARCHARRRWMRDTLGLPVHNDVLPLSNLSGIVPPYLLQTRRIFALS